MLQYPLNLSFKLIALSSRVQVTDASGQQVAYVHGKKFKLKEDTGIYTDESRQRELFRIKADRVIDFGANYHIYTPDGNTVGAVRRKGMRSLWKATYEIVDQHGQPVGLIHEENAWVKVLDALVGELPVVGMFTGMFLNPAYLIDLRGQTVLYLKKEPAVFEGKFRLEQRGAISDADEPLLLSSVIMALLLERSRG